MEQINISEEGVLACPEEVRRASGERRILEEVRRNRDRRAPCSWDRDRRLRAWVLVSLHKYGRMSE